MLLRYADGAGEAESDTVSADLMAMDGGGFQAFHHVHLFQLVVGGDIHRDGEYHRQHRRQAVGDTVSADLMAMDGVDSYSYIATLRDNFTDSMEAINSMNRSWSSTTNRYASWAGPLVDASSRVWLVSR